MVFSTQLNGDNEDGLNYNDYLFNYNFGPITRCNAYINASFGQASDPRYPLVGADKKPIDLNTAWTTIRGSAGKTCADNFGNVMQKIRDY